MSAENPKFWGMKDDEYYDCNSIWEYINKFCEEHDDDSIPETIDLIGFDPVVVNEEKQADWVLENFLESLDENYSNPDNDYTKPTDGMKLAAKEFVKKILSEYQVTTCERVCKKTVQIKDYMSE
jgi:hypothetical protein